MFQTLIVSLVLSRLNYRNAVLVVVAVAAAAAEFFNKTLSNTK